VLLDVSSHRPFLAAKRSLDVRFLPERAKGRQAAGSPKLAVEFAELEGSSVERAVCVRPRLV